MRKVYFSHSYRDRSINSHFLDKFVKEDFALLADQKSDTWCVAKLERYMLESSGFVSIIPRRGTEKKASYSDYIGHELALARRSRLPRLFFVDRLLLDRFRSDFPEDAVPFESDSLGDFDSLHNTRISMFEESLLPKPASSMLGDQDRKRAVIVAPNQRYLLRAAEGISAVLGSSGYKVRHLTGNRLGKSLDDVRLLENLWEADLCIFLLGDRVSQANVMMGMAHAHCIPSIRFKYDKKSVLPQPNVAGVINWSDINQLIDVFVAQFQSFSSGMQHPVEMAKESSSEEAILSLSTGEWDSSLNNQWDPLDGDSVVKHLSIEASYVVDRVNRAKSALQFGFGPNRSRKRSMKICRQLYDDLKDRSDFVYDYEPQSSLTKTQAIRTADDLDASNSATCLDLACLFSSLLEAASQRSVILVLEKGGGAHALVGCWAPDEPILSHGKSLNLGEIRGAEQRSDLVLFEPTGVAQSEKIVAGEADEDRKLGGGRLDFTASKRAARALIFQQDVRLRFLVDINPLRTKQ